VKRLLLDKRNPFLQYLFVSVGVIDVRRFAAVNML